MRALVSMLVLLAIAAPVVADPTPEQITKVRAELMHSLTESLVGMLTEWKTEMLNIPPYIYEIDKIERSVTPEASEMVEANANAARRFLIKAQIRMHLINALAEAGLPPITDSSMVDAIAAKVAQTASQAATYADEQVALAVVGVGEPDAYTIKARGPARAAVVAARLLSGVPELVFPGH